MSNGCIYQYELHGLDIPGGHQTPPGSSSPSDFEWKAIVLVFVDQQVVVAAVEDLLAGGALVGGGSLTEETFSCSTDRLLVRKYFYQDKDSPFLSRLLDLLLLFSLLTWGPKGGILSQDLLFLIICQRNILETSHEHLNHR